MKPSVISRPVRVRSSGHGDTRPALTAGALRWACRAIGRKPRQAPSARKPIAPTPAEGEPSCCATGTISTATTVAPVVMVTRVQRRHQRRPVREMDPDEGRHRHVADRQPGHPDDGARQQHAGGRDAADQQPGREQHEGEQDGLLQPQARVSHDVAAPATAKHSVGMEGMIAAISGP